MCYEWYSRNVVILAGVSKGTKKSGIGGLGYLFTFLRVLFEFLTLWRQGDDILRQSGRGFKAGKKVISMRIAQPSILPRACAVPYAVIYFREIFTALLWEFHF